MALQFRFARVSQARKANNGRSAASNSLLCFACVLTRTHTEEERRHSHPRSESPLLRLLSHSLSLL